MQTPPQTASPDTDLFIGGQISNREWPILRFRRMDKQDEYRFNAAEAQRQADRANSDIDRAAWLRLVQGWLSLLTKRPQTAQESFDQEVSDKATGQDESKSSN